MTEHWSWLTGSVSEAGEYTYSPPSRPSRPPHRPLVKLATSAHLHTIASPPRRMEQQTMPRLFQVSIVLLGIVMLRVESSKDVVMQMSKTFSKPMEACRKEMELPESVTQDFMNFWKEDYQLTDRSTGCAIMCLSSKLDLLDADYKLHHGKAAEFAKQHGADDAKAKQLVDLIHNCAQSFPVIPDSCELTLSIAKCFKAEIHKLDWAPSMELIVAEILAET